MSRPLRIDLAGGYYHVLNRGLERRAIFEDNRDRQRWVGLLAELPERFGVVVHAWVLMGNHYHLQIETPEANLSRAVQWLNVSYAVWFNRRHDRVGPLFQGRFKAEITDTEQWVAEVSRYIHLNPVRVRALGMDKASVARSRAPGGREAPGREELAARWKRLTEYRWSSCRAYLGLEAAPDWLEVDAVRSRFGGRGRTEQIRNYRSALRELVGEGGDWEEGPWERAIGGAVLGGKAFAERMFKRLKAVGRGVTGRRVVEQRRSLGEWKRAMEKMRGEKWEVFARRHGDPGRDLVLLAARRRGRLTLRELGEEVGLDFGSISNALHRANRRIEQDSTTRREWERLLKCSDQEP
jgi:putative transposase